MNYYKARQRQKDQRWDYTCQNGSGTYAVGYCAGWREVTDQTPEYLREMIQRDIEKRRPHREWYHTDGHATSAEADACYRRYQLDQELRLSPPPEKPDILHKCAVCGAFTAGLAEVGTYRHWYLCDEHRTREHAEKLYPGISESWES